MNFWRILHFKLINYEYLDTLIKISIYHSHGNDAFVLTDSARRGDKSGWDYTVRVNDLFVADGSATVEITTSSMKMEIKDILEVLK